MVALSEPGAAMPFEPQRLTRLRVGFWLLVLISLVVFALELPGSLAPPYAFSGFFWLPLLLVPALNRPIYLLGLGSLDLLLTLWLLLTGSDELVQTILQEMPLRAAVFLLILCLDQLRVAQDGSRRLLQAIQIASPVAMALVEHPSGRMLQLNPAMARLLGSSVEQLEGRCWLDFSSSLSPCKPAQPQQVFGCSGQPRWVQLGIHPLELFGQGRELLVIQALDCQDAVEGEAALAAQAEELRRQLAVSLEACSLAHEIRQPLSLLQLQCRRLLQQLEARSSEPSLPSENQQLNRDLETLATTVEDLNGTVAAMVSLLRSGASPMEQVDLAGVARACLKSLQPRLAALGVQLTLQGLDSPLPVFANQVQLRIACGNLLANSLEALRDQPQPQRRILLEVRISGGGAVLRVGDNGPGLKGRSLSQLTLASSKSDGMGLGLFTTALIAQQHHGELQAGVSPELGGAELRLLLPCAGPAGLTRSEPPRTRSDAEPPPAPTQLR